MGGKSRVEVQRVNAMELHRRYQRLGPEIVRFAQVHGDRAALTEFGIRSAETLERVYQRESKRKEEGCHAKPPSVNKLFLYKDNASYFQALVQAIIRTVSRLEVALAEKEEELRARIAEKDKEIEELKADIERLSHRDPDGEALMDLLETLATVPEG